MTPAEQLAALYAAVRYVLDRSQTDAELGYRIGPVTEAFRRLCLAEAAMTGKPLEQVEAARRADLTPDHHLRPPRHEADAQRIELLEEFVSEDQLREVDEDLEVWKAGWVGRRLQRRAGAAQ